MCEVEAKYLEVATLIPELEDDDDPSPSSSESFPANNQKRLLAGETPIVPGRGPGGAPSGEGSGGSVVEALPCRSSSYSLVSPPRRR